MTTTALLRRGIAERQAHWRYRVHRGRVRFDDDVRRVHRRLRQSLPAYLRGANFFSLTTAPLIYSLLLPLVLLDLWVSVYQWVCFPIYGLARVRRRRYFPLDRHRLDYLNAIEKANCTFCTYANGVIAYAREVAARTEQYWCPIRHARAVAAPHRLYGTFFDYGDAERYHRELVPLRRTMQPAGRWRPRTIRRRQR